MCSLNYLLSTYYVTNSVPGTEQGSKYSSVSKTDQLPVSLKLANR